MVGFGHDNVGRLPVRLKRGRGGIGHSEAGEGTAQEGMGVERGM